MSERYINVILRKINMKLISIKSLVNIYNRNNLGLVEHHIYFEVVKRRFEITQVVLSLFNKPKSHFEPLKFFFTYCINLVIRNFFISLISEHI